MKLSRKHMQAAAVIVERLSDKEQRMTVLEAFVDLFIATNESFNLRRFLASCNVSDEEWNKERVHMPKREVKSE